MKLRPAGLCQLAVKGGVFLLRHRTVEVVGLALAVSRGKEGLSGVDGASVDDRRSGVEKVQSGAAELGRDRVREGVGGKRAGGYYRHAGFGDRSYLPGYHLDIRTGLYHTCDVGREPLSVDGERRACGDAVGVGGLHDRRSERPHLLLEKADRVGRAVRPEGVRADELGEIRVFVGGSVFFGFHLVELYPDSQSHCRQRRLASGKAGAYYVDRLFFHQVSSGASSSVGSGASGPS